MLLLERLLVKNDDETPVQRFVGYSEYDVGDTAKRSHEEPTSLKKLENSDAENEETELISIANASRLSFKFLNFQGVIISTMYLDFFADSNMPVFPKYSLISHYDFNKVRIIKDIFTILSVSSFVLPYTLLSRLKQQLDKYKELIKREFDDTELTGPEPKLTGDYERGRKAVVDDSTEASGEWKLKRPMEDDTSVTFNYIYSSQ